MKHKYRLLVRIEGIHCGGCLSRIQRELELAGASQIDVDLKTGMASLVYEGEKSSYQRFIKTIESIGYQAKMPAIAPVK